MSFDGVARVDALRVPDTVGAGETIESRLVWQPLVSHPEPYQVSLQLDDPSSGDGATTDAEPMDLATMIPTAQALVALRNALAHGIERL